MSKLVTVRVTIRHFEAPRSEWAAIGDEIVAAAVRLAAQTTLIGTKADIELVDGSLKATAVLAGALTIYGAIADYKGFKESVTEMAQDSIKVATAIENAIPKIVGSIHGFAPQDVRKGSRVVPAVEIAKLIEGLENLKGNSKTMSGEELDAEIDRIARRLRSLRRQLDAKDMALVREHIALGDLPIPVGPRRRPTVNPGAGDIIQPDTHDALRRRIEEAEWEKPKSSSSSNSARESTPARRPRRMYFRSVIVGSSEALSLI